MHKLFNKNCNFIMFKSNNNFIKNFDSWQLRIHIHPYTQFKESSSFKTNSTFVCIYLIFKMKIN